MDKRLLIGGGIVLVVVVLVLALSGQSKTTTPQPVQPSGQTQQTQTPQTIDRGVEKTVTVTESGFEPSTITIKAGTRVLWMNKSGKTVTVNSDQHPTHKLYPFLNLGAFDNGSSVQIVFDKPGTYTYHDHLNPSHTGKVMVE